MDWYYSDGTSRSGPVSDEMFHQLVNAGVITDSTLVWNATMSNWQSYGIVRPKRADPAPVPAMAPAAYAPAPAPAPARDPYAVAPSPAAAPAFCSQCGRRYTQADLVAISGRMVCANCKPALLQQMREGAVPVGQRVRYAGFWIRFAAVLIDSVILSVVNVTLSMTVLAWAVASGDPNMTAAAGALVYLVGVAIGVSYEGYFLVNKGATLGKMALGLRVIRTSGAPITWGLAIGRYFGKIVSAMILLIGYLMVAWDPEKRALHDRMCDTRVIKV